MNYFTNHKPLPQWQEQNCCHRSSVSLTQTKWRLWTLPWSSLLTGCEVGQDKALPGSTLAPVPAGTCRAVLDHFAGLLRDKTRAISGYVSAWKSISLLQKGKKGEKKKPQREEGEPQQLLLLVLSIVSLKLTCWSSLLWPSHSFLSGTFWQQCLLMSYLRRTSSCADSSLTNDLEKCYMKELGKHSNKHLHLQMGNSYRGALSWWFVHCVIWIIWDLNSGFSNLLASCTYSFRGSCSSHGLRYADL